MKNLVLGLFLPLLVASITYLIGEQFGPVAMVGFALIVAGGMFAYIVTRHIRKSSESAETAPEQFETDASAQTSEGKGGFHA